VSGHPYCDSRSEASLRVWGTGGRSEAKKTVELSVEHSRFLVITAHRIV
jgi:hypothetical protein